MDTTQNKYLSVSYALYTIDEEGKSHLVEQTQQGEPFRFISGLGFSLDAFEQQLVNLEPGAKFDFTLAPADAFGEYDEEGVHVMEREKFFVNDKFDDKHIFPGAIISLEADDKRFMARVASIDEKGVTVDTNHPLAGETLRFTGMLLENREASTDEITALLNRMSHECGGCDDCGEEGCGGCGGCH